MNIYYTLFYITTSLLIILLIFKTYLFLFRSNFQQLTDWVFFDKHSIYTSRGLKAIKAKRVQNILSFAILILGTIDATFLLLAHLA